MLLLGEAEDDADAMEKDLFGDEDLTTAKADADEVVEVLEPVRERGPQSYSSAPSSSRTAEGDVAEDDGVVAVGAVATSSTTSSASGSANQKRPLPEQISDSEYEREQERRKKVTRSGVEDNAAGVIVLDDDDDAEVEAKDPTEHMEDGKQEGEDVAGEEDALVEEEIRDPERGKSVFDIIEEEEAQKKAAKKKRPKAKAAKPKKEPKPKKETKKKEPKRPPKPKKEAVKRPEAKVPNLKFDLSLMKTWTWDMFRTFAVLSGCDYTVHVHVKGLAIGTAAKLVHCFKERALDVVVKKFPLPCAPKAFVEALHLALSVFRHHIVFDKKRGDLLHFSEALRRCRRLGIESADPEVIQSLPGCSDRTRACGDLRKLDLRRMPALCAGELRPKTMEPRPKDPLNQAEKKMLKYLRERKNKNMRMHMKHVANAAEAKGKEEVVLEHQGPVPEEHVFSFTPPGGIMRPAEPRNDTSFGAIHTGFSTPTKHSPSLTFQDELAAMRAWYAEGQKIEQQVQEERDFIQENAADLLQVPPLVGDVLELNKENLLPKENKTTSTSAVSSSSSTTLHCGNGAIKLSSTTTSVNKSGARGAVTSTTATTNNTTMTLRANSRSLYIPEPQPTTATENVGATSLASATVRQNPFRRRGAGPRQAPTTGGTSSSMLMNTASSTTGAAPGSSSTGQARVDAFLGQLRDPKKYDEEKHNPGLDKFHKKKNPLGGMFF
ncbi:unnamed protein product [Amoebophrya sp. A25]|nr:unnamed protein product [Amoebophrya sp. A25]|eukprot:GSA25T00018481001.1